MNWVLSIVSGLIAALIVWFEWPKINQKQKKEKQALVTLSIMGWVLAVLLIFFPDMPGPTDLVDYIYRPLGKLLE
ncbi:hypothetical protein ACJ2A9_03455 [Anaerobacillus sp. MEB173]|uniref:hypothetical protein n=1 Tax=Anaerobacillus sp. MEB173 TaxID=3383345 RepID=UPI003F923431